MQTAMEWELLLREYKPTMLVSWWTTPAIPQAILADDAHPLRYICHAGGSVKGVVPREFIAKGGLVTNWGSLISHTVAEHALLLILASLRNMRSWDSTPSFAVNGEKNWGNPSVFGTMSLRGRRVGIHGFGSIARELVQLLKPFEARCSAYSENVPADFMTRHGVVPCWDLKELFSRSEILVECEALTPRSEGSVTAELLHMLPDEAVFVNVARGRIVDERALERIVAAGRLRVAADVFQIEPLPDDSPLRNQRNMIISPHIGGPTYDWYPRCGEFAIANIARYLSGDMMESVVTLEIYDQST